MRSAFCILFLAALAGCPGSLQTDSLNGGGDDGDGSGSGSGAGNVPTECFQNSDCTPAGAKCCDCPTHAVPLNDPTHSACNEVQCPPGNACGSPMQAVCQVGKCELVCSPVVCDANVTCANGFETDGNGCLTCTCAAPTSSQCSGDGDCAQVRDDCCGCTLGGKDTAIPQSEVASHEAGLSCSANPTCPGIDTCAPDLAARCVQGECELVSGLLPQNACGRADLPACAAGDRCTVNANDQATMYGVGVCQP